MVKFLIGRLYSDNHTRYSDVIGCCVITFGGSLFMLCVLACYIYVVCFDVTVQYFDVVICLIPLTDSFFFCVINQDFCFVLAWSLKYILARSLLFMFVFGVSLFMLCVLTLS